MSLSVGDVFWLVNPHFPDVPAHLHIVVGITENRRIFCVYTTTKKHTVERMCMRAEDKTNPQHLNTMVTITPSDCSELTEISYINANLSYELEEYVLTRKPTYRLCDGVKVAESAMTKIILALLSSNATVKILRDILLQRLNPSS